jgi:NAD(P)H-dependent FMN reductase
MIRIGIIIGSTRPGRNGGQVASWVHGAASRRSEATFELIDLRDHPLPHLDEPLPAKLGRYQQVHTKAWSDTIASFDGFIIVTPEYNQSIPGVLKNALDYLYSEWGGKAAGIVCYGAGGGTRAAAQLRLICGALQMATVSRQVALSLMADFENFTSFKPGDHQAAALDTLLDQVLASTTETLALRAASRTAA